MKDETEVQREDYMGMIKYARITHGKAVPLFGTDVQCSAGVSLSIAQGEVQRNLSRDWYLGDCSPVIEVEMSPIQWAEFLTSGNCGTGVPCTIRHLQGAKCSEPDFKPSVAHFSEEARDSLQDFDKSYSKILDVLNDHIKEGKPLTAAAMTKLVHDLEIERHNNAANLKYVASAFQEEMSKTVTRAKAEIAAYIEQREVEVGKQAMIDANINEDKIIKGLADNTAGDTHEDR